MKRIFGVVLLGLLICNVAVFIDASSVPTNKDIILATTTSTQDSGLLDVLIPIFEKETGFIVKTIAVGSGKALAMGQKGEADVLLTHAPDDELKLVNDGSVINRQLVMHNDFIIVGPQSDPAKVKGMTSTTLALKKIYQSKALFISRGDESGTHKMEKKLWEKANPKPETNWYQETGSGMGDTLNIASYKEGYTLTDRATFLALKKNLNLLIAVEGDAGLLNIYHVMEVNPEKFPLLNAKGGKSFADFLVSKKAQELIADYGVAKFGEPLFFPDAGKKETELSKNK